MKVALVGYGHLGKWHAEKMNLIYGENFYAIVESDTSKHRTICEKYPNVRIVDNLDEVIDTVGAVVIATPTSYHFRIIEKSVMNNKHCFVEKPMTANIEESFLVGDLLKNKKLIFQVGHSERFHLFWQHLLRKEEFINASIIRIERLAPYKGRGDDVDIIYDLMIHDYDLLNMLKIGTPISVEAWGNSCHTKMIDYCISKIKYEDKVAFITASRSSNKEKRNAEFVFDDGILELDLMNETVNRSHQGSASETLEFQKCDHLLEEHKLFKQSIESKKNNEINYDIGHESMKLIELTLESIKCGTAVSWS